LRVVHNPGDQPAWLRLLTMPAGIGPATAAGLLTQLRGHKKIADVIDLEPTLMRGQSGWQILRETLSRVVKAVDQNPNNLVTEILRSWYREYLETQYRDWQDRLADLEQLGRFAATFADLQTFLSEASLQEQYAANRQKPGQKDDSDKLVLSTIHQAKGLEWHAVFVVNLAQGSFPHRRSLFSSDEIEEERRLFYVAVTRARRLLYLSYPLINEGSADSLNQRSQFLEELPWGVSEEQNPAPPPRDDSEQTIEIGSDGERKISFLPDIGKL
jgi:DNA helicase-2/ATP-dependent DNA helicase PcrA